jgi:acyl-coenzyme A thioesterase PaaI-like protein
VWLGSEFVERPGAEDIDLTVCVACRRSGQCRLGLRGERLESDGRTTTDLMCSREHEGGPGVAHGSWTAGVFDEVMGRLPTLHGVAVVTGTLTVRFLKPVPIELPLFAETRVTGREGSRWFLTASLHLTSSGVELATGEGVMVQRDRNKHFVEYGEWLAAQQRSG